jgi:hypothetical protein
MSEVVLMDGQWTMCRFLRPFENFERVYQGKDGTTPIAFPGDLDLFAQKGVTGYDPNLMAGVTVPYGSRVTIWIPQTIAGTVVDALYQYQILWRLRNVRDYRAGQAEGQATPNQNYSGYHLSTSGFGQPEVAGAQPNSPNSRFFIPGAVRTAAFPQAEPASGLSGVVHLTGEMLTPTLDPIWVQPLTPKGTPGIWQQGAYVGSSHTNNGGPSWLTFECQALGDEMSILAFKIPPGEGSPPAWDFSAAAPGDLSFSNTFGNGNGQNQRTPYTSILVTTGTS